VAHQIETEEAVLDDLDPGVLAGHWFARITENGVPVQDLRDTAARTGSWRQWCPEWEKTADARMNEADAAEHDGAALTAAELRLIAALEYHFGKFLFVHDRAAHRAVHDKAVAAYRRAMTGLPWPGEAVDVAYRGTGLRGVLRRPDRTAEPAPVVIVVPGLDATKEEMHRLQEVFLRRGMATYSPDGPGQGEAEFASVLEPDWERVASATVDTLQQIDGLDPDRIALIGVSLGGYFAGRAAAREPRLRAAASIGGCYSMGQAWPNLSLLTRQAFAVRSGAYPPAEGFGAGPPDERARSLAGTFTVADAPPQYDTPFLVMHGGNDRLFDERQARGLAEHFGARAELVVEPAGNHVLHNLAYRARPRVADWVSARLGPA
jgi:alpha-beta hydrolase superfamily lysophospholipase